MMKPEKYVYIQEEKQSIKTDPKTTQMLQLADKLFKAVIINMFKDLRGSICIRNRLRISEEKQKL